MDAGLEKWLRENYPLLTAKECAKELMVSPSKIKVWARELGLRKNKAAMGKDRKEPIVIARPKFTGDIGYCRECKHYVLGGHCGKTGKETGALNEKQCFKRKKK